MSHIYSDESGGAAPSEAHFTLAAVCVDDTTATRTIKAFRKVSKLPGEIKGSSLNPKNRKLFMEIMADQGCGQGAAVVCVRGDALGSWALRQQHEQLLYRHLMAEAFEVLGIGPHIRGITADGGRYTHIERRAIASDLAVDIERLAGRAVPFGYRDSASSPGLQIVDVLCNTAGKLLTDNRQRDIAQEALAPLLSQGLVTVRPAKLPGLKPPVWLQRATEAA